MARLMSVAQLVNDFITENRPAGFCNACVGARLNLYREGQASIITTTLDHMFA